MFRRGDIIGEYEIVTRLRSGGMATLYLGRQRGAAGFARPVAIKVIHPHLASIKSFVQMFINEAQLSAKISDPHVVRVEQLGEANGAYFLVMEYVHGCSLADMLRALETKRERMPASLATYIATQIAAGLHAAHTTAGQDGEPLGVVHRDVSPHNILFAYEGHIKLIDFGVAKARGQGGESNTGSLKGKIAYMAPEQASGQEVDRRSDVYALGILLWEMLTMRRLFAADNDIALLEQVRSPRIAPPSKFASGITPALDRAVMTALSINPGERPANAQIFRKMLIDAMPACSSMDGSDVSRFLSTHLADRIRDEARRMPAVLGSDPYEAGSVSRTRDHVNTLTIGQARAASFGAPAAQSLEKRERRRRWMAASVGGAAVALALVYAFGFTRPRSATDAQRKLAASSAVAPSAAVANADDKSTAIAAATTATGELQPAAPSTSEASPAPVAPAAPAVAAVTREEPPTQAATRTTTRSPRPASPKHHSAGATATKATPKKPVEVINGVPMVSQDPF